MSIAIFHSTNRGKVMAQDEALLRIVYKYSDEEYEIPLADLVAALTVFLDHFAEKSMVGDSFYSIVDTGDGQIKFSRLLDACGYSKNPKGFFENLLDQLGKADGSAQIAINGIELPHMLLISVLEVALPGNKFISIKSTDQLEKACNLKVPESERHDIQKVIDTYPVRLSLHTIPQMRVSPDVPYQYLPFTQELDTHGHTKTLIGQLHQGLLDHIYHNR